MKAKWPIVPLRELCQFRHGGTPSKAEPANWLGSFPWVSPKDMRSDVLQDTQDHLSADAASSHAIVAKKDSLLVVVRSGILAHTFPIAIAGRDMAYNQDLKSLQVTSPLVGFRYVFRFLQASTSTILAHGTKRGATVHSIQSGFLESLPTPMPSLPEQHRIVSILDEAENLRRLRQQADRRTADLIPALFHEMFGDLATSRHPTARLTDVAEVVSGIAKGRRFDGQPTVLAPYLRVANVQAGFLDLAEIKQIEALPREVEELTLKAGDVLLTEGGDHDKLGRGAMWEGHISNCIHQNHVFRVRTRARLVPLYFAKYLMTPTARTYFNRCAKKTSNLASINMTQLRALPIPLPPLPLQKQFVARVAEIRDMQDHQAASRRRLDDLFQSLLHRAFQGQL